LAKGQRRGEIGFGRFLRNPSVTIANISAGAASRTSEAVAGRDVLAIQDTSDIVLGAKKVRERGYGPVGRGGALGGVLLHPVLAVDAASGEVLGLADVNVWNRQGGKVSKRTIRSLEEKESRRWLTGIEQAAQVLNKANSVTVVSDRESDIYEDFARRPETVHLLIRSSSNRNLVGGGKLLDYADALPEMGRFQITVPAKPGQTARLALLAVRFGPLAITRPQRGMPSAALNVLPESVDLHLVDVREVDAPDGISPIHWRLLTSHNVACMAAARKMIDHYRKRWIIEDYFRTLKSAGFQIEDADIADPQVMLKFIALAAIAAVTVTQLLRARDNPTGQNVMVAFDPDDQPVLAAICKDYEGKSPTRRQTNPHPPDTLAFATWVIARLGGWTGYYGKPGAQTLNRGLQRFFAIKYGSIITRRLV
jgi:hypothetical protein